MTIRLLKKLVYEIGGRPELVVYGDSTAVFNATGLRSMVNTGAEPHRDAIRIVFLGGTRASGIPFEVPENASTVYDSNGVLLRENGVFLYGSWYGIARSITDRKHRQAIIVMPAAGRFNKDYISRFIFRPILDELLCLNGYVPLHAAGIVLRWGGCIIAGSAGSGKSSLVMELVNGGSGFIADDRVLVRKTGASGNICMMYAFPEFIRFSRSPRGVKRLLKPPVPAINEAPVKVILLLDGKQNVKSVSITTVGKAEAAARLMHHVSPNLQISDIRSAFDMIGDLCGTAVTFRISGWGDPGEMIRRVSGLLGGFSDDMQS
ncbi:hypothetical protein LLG96_15725 [bacterium]|nr:hypothetical protein [bacterium]